jgi:Leucine-rich repeat (LRR) protein
MKFIVLLICAFISFTCYSQRVKIIDNNFEQALIDLKIDSDKEVNGYLLKSDAQLVTFLDVSNKKIKDLTGIEEFTSLLYLDCRNNQLSNIDFSHNIALTNLFCDVNDIINPNGFFINPIWFD